jgi:hypothetical protein
LVRVSVRMGSLAESNLFLRAVWARMRAHFGRLGWQLTPSRSGVARKIRFGWASLGQPGKSWPDNVEIAIHYKRIGIIDSIIFQAQGSIYQRIPDLDSTLRSCVEEALEIYSAPSSQMTATQVRSNPYIPFTLYRGTRWYVGPLSSDRTELGLAVSAFDESDRAYEFKVRLGSILDVLSVWTNCAFEKFDEYDHEAKPIDLKANIFLKRSDWLDDFPVENDRLCLESLSLEFGNKIIDGTIDADHRLLRAVRLFHQGLALHRLPSLNFGDLSVVILISALEAMMEETASSVCQSCGQSIYKISKRVRDLATQHLGDAMVRIFTHYYARRSQFVHTGRIYAAQPLTSALT